MRRKDEVKASLPGSVAEISIKLDMTQSAVARALRELEAEKLAHIDAYPEPGQRGMHWAPGPRPDGAELRPPKRRDAKEPGPGWAQPIRSTVNEDATIERAKGSPARWFSALDAA